MILGDGKTHHNQRVRCSRHPDQIAAVCPECYDSALRQQAHQEAAARREAHARYLEKSARFGAASFVEGAQNVSR